MNIPAAYATFGKQCRSLFTGNKNNTYSKPLVLRKAIKEGMRVKPNTNILQEWDEKKGWKDAGAYRDFIRKDQDVFVGGDGAGLELRMLTHYLLYVPKMLLEEVQRDFDEGVLTKNMYDFMKKKYEDALRSALEYREQLLHGDIHSHNQKLAGLETRNQAKTFI